MTCQLTAWPGTWAGGLFCGTALRVLRSIAGPSAAACLFTAGAWGKRDGQSLTASVCRWFGGKCYSHEHEACIFLPALKVTESLSASQEFLGVPYIPQRSEGDSGQCCLFSRFTRYTMRPRAVAPVGRSAFTPQGADP